MKFSHIRIALAALGLFAFAAASAQAHPGHSSEIMPAPLIMDVQANSGVEPAHFHHVHLNVADPDETLKFYQLNLGTNKTQYRDRKPALFTEKSFIFYNKVDEAPEYLPVTAINHIGWSSTDGPADYNFLKSRGVEFQTDVTLVPQLGNNHAMYFYGPDKELIELWTGNRNHRFEHVHLWATDVQEMADWFNTHFGTRIGVGPKPQTQEPDNVLALWMASGRIDNVNLIIFGRPSFESIFFPGYGYPPDQGPGEEFEPTEGHVIDHIAFSYVDIEPVFDRMKEAGVEIVKEIAEDPDYGHRSFFVRAPDNILVEVVEEKPIPEGIWME